MPKCENNIAHIPIFFGKVWLERELLLLLEKQLNIVSFIISNVEINVTLHAPVLCIVQIVSALYHPAPTKLQ